MKATRLTCSDLVLLFLKLSIAVPFIIVAGPLLGVLILVLVNLLIEKFISLVFWVEPLNSTDKNVFYDQETNRCHIMGVILLDKTDENNIREIFAKRMTSRFFRLRSKMVKILDAYYFKELSNEEL